MTSLTATDVQLHQCHLKLSAGAVLATPDVFKASIRLLYTQPNTSRRARLSEGGTCAADMREGSGSPDPRPAHTQL